jgi:hypothetical protein
MCHCLIGEEVFKRELRRYKKVFERRKGDRRALNKISPKIKYFQRLAHQFDLSIDYNPRRYMKYLKIKVLPSLSELKQLIKKDNRFAIDDSDSDCDSDIDEEIEAGLKVVSFPAAIFITKITTAKTA